jgi:hypothetical protein
MRSKPLFFYHVPKTGGDALISAAVDALGRSRVLDFFDNDAGRIGKRLDPLLNEHGFAFFHGHVSPTRLPPRDAFISAAILRDPTERMLSHFCYAYENRFRGHRLSQYFRRPEHLGRPQFGYADMIHWLKEFKWDNVQTRFLSGTFRAPVGEAECARALEALEKLDIVGVTENLDPFFASVGDVLGAPLRIRVTNTSDRRVLNIDESERRLLCSEFLRFDEIVYRAAQKKAAALADRVAQTEAQPALPRDDIAGYLRWLRYRTPREYLRIGARRVLVPSRKFWERMLVVRAQKRPSARHEEATAPELSER